MAPRAYAAVVGIVFGLTLCWVRFSDPGAIRRMLLFEDGYLWLIFASAVAISFVAIRLVRRLARRAIWTREPIAWDRGQRPTRSHIAGGALFGLGWAITATCPGPAATQLGQGIGWSVFVIAGIVLGIKLHARREPRTAVDAPDPRQRSALSPV
jgi:uncharacterized membrane protein YedE/YeeE